MHNFRVKLSYLAQFHAFGTILWTNGTLLNTWSKFLLKFVPLNQAQKILISAIFGSIKPFQQIPQEGCKFNIHVDRAMETLGTCCIEGSNWQCTAVNRRQWWLRERNAKAWLKLSKEWTRYLKNQNLCDKIKLNCTSAQEIRRKVILT